MKKLQNSLMLILLSLYFTACASTQSINLIKEKAELGDKESQYLLGIYYKENKSFSKAFELFTQSANQNYPVAQNELGNCYLEGKGVDKNNEKALYWYRKAAEHKYFDAINNLGYMYDLGLGIKENNNKAIEFYEDAASKGSIRAMSNVAHMYKNGEGTPKNIVEAYKWFELARYYTGRSKNISLKWSVRKELDNLKTIMSQKEIDEAINLAKLWSLQVSK